VPALSHSDRGGIASLVCRRWRLWGIVLRRNPASEETASYLITNGRLEILSADVTVPDGSKVFSAATEAFGIGSPVGAPLLVVGDQVMRGSEDA
jgi:hypothetical protein